METIINNNSNGQQPRLYKISKAAELLGASKSALRMWANRGMIKYLRTPGGQRLFDISSLVSTQPPPTPPPAAAAAPAPADARPSSLPHTIVAFGSSATAKAVDRAVVGAASSSAASGGKIAIEIFDAVDPAATPLSSRPGFRQLLGLAVAGQVSAVYVRSKDELSGGGGSAADDIVSWLLGRLNVDVCLVQGGQRSAAAASRRGGGRA